MPGIVIAVLDDDQDLTNSICAHFEASRYDARPFYRMAGLATSAKVQRHDGFVIDRIVGEAAKSPIVVLTVQMLMGVVDETDTA